MQTTRRNSIAPLTRATGLGSLPQLLTKMESERALHKAFQAEGISLTILDQPNLYLPIRSLSAIYERAARSAGARDFGLRVGQSTHHHGYGLWIQYCTEAPTLGQALQRTRLVSRFQQPGSRVTIDRMDHQALWRFWSHYRATGVHHTDQILFRMVKVAQYYLGAAWKPDWLEVNYRRDADAHVIEEVLGIPVRFGQSAIGMAMPASKLSCPSQELPPTSPLTLLDLEADNFIDEGDGPLEPLRAITVLRLMEGKADLDGAAEMAGVSVRSLQRILNREGMTYRQLVEHVRMARARALLEGTSLTVTQVALALGYSEHANFTRAFSRWSGQSPVAFRRLARLWTGQAPEVQA